MERPKTIFLDIDGTLVKHKPLCENTLGDIKLELLEGTLEKLTEFGFKASDIINIKPKKMIIK
jgi:FMN phosphatase YigB (HAD superfamily)